MTSSSETTVQFIGQCSFSEIGSGDKTVQFKNGRVELTRSQLRLSEVMDDSTKISSQTAFELRDLRSASLHLADVNRSNQLQLEYKKSVWVVHVLGSNQRNDDIRTEQLFNLLTSEGVPLGRSEIYYFAGMDLTEAEASNGERGILSTATGVVFGQIIWDSIKAAGSFLISPFKPY